jgi:DinB family protein
MTLTTELVAALDGPHAALRETLAVCPAAVLDRKGVVGRWSIKNVLAHLVTWQSLVVDSLPGRITTAVVPKVFTMPPAERFAFLVERIGERDALSPQQQIVELERTHRRVDGFIRSLGDDLLAQDHIWPEWPGTLAAYLAGLGSIEQAALDRIRTGLQRLPPE